jgi:hypothetical protein
MRRFAPRAHLAAKASHSRSRSPTWPRPSGTGAGNSRPRGHRPSSASAGVRRCRTSARAAGASVHPAQGLQRQAQQRAEQRAAGVHAQVFQRGHAARHKLLQGFAAVRQRAQPRQHHADGAASGRKASVAAPPGWRRKATPSSAPSGRPAQQVGVDVEGILVDRARQRRQRPQASGPVASASPRTDTGWHTAPAPRPANASQTAELPGRCPVMRSLWLAHLRRTVTRHGAARLPKKAALDGSRARKPYRCHHAKAPAQGGKAGNDSLAAIIHRPL